MGKRQIDFCQRVIHFIKEIFLQATKNRYLFNKLTIKTKTMKVSKITSSLFILMFVSVIVLAQEDKETQYLFKKGDISISGFGGFELKDKGERPGRNPKTGEDIPIAARRVVTFRAGQKLKELIEESLPDTQD